MMYKWSLPFAAILGGWTGQNGSFYICFVPTTQNGSGWEEASYMLCHWGWHFILIKQNTDFCIVVLKTDNKAHDQIICKMTFLSSSSSDYPTPQNKKSYPLCALSLYLYQLKFSLVGSDSLLGINQGKHWIHQLKLVDLTEKPFILKVGTIVLMAWLNTIVDTMNEWESFELQYMPGKWEMWMYVKVSNVTIIKTGSVRTEQIRPVSN